MLCVLFGERDRDILEPQHIAFLFLIVWKIKVGFQSIEKFRIAKYGISHRNGLRFGYTFCLMLVLKISVLSVELTTSNTN
jgi:hypothetical protein